MGRPLMDQALMVPPSLVNEFDAFNLGVQGPVIPFYEAKEKAPYTYVYVRIHQKSVNAHPRIATLRNTRGGAHSMESILC